jgi:hypothetical protein
MSALSEAIGIWREHASITSLDDFSWKSCPLCAEHPQCVGCPVFKKNRQDSCERTSFYDAHDKRRDGDLPGFVIEAKKMVALLESCQ